MSMWMKAYIAFMVILLSLMVFLYLRDYYWAMEEAKEYGRKGDYEGMRLMLDYAHTRIRNILIMLFVFIPIIAGSISYYHKQRSKIKQ
ncbi:MAG: hypothetical protein QXS76_00940 [Candidatus Bathyarchaeia archaeon]